MENFFGLCLCALVRGEEPTAPTTKRLYHLSSAATLKFARVQVIRKKKESSDFLTFSSWMRVFYVTALRAALWAFCGNRGPLRNRAFERNSDTISNVALSVSRFSSFNLARYTRVYAGIYGEIRHSKLPPCNN